MRISCFWLLCVYQISREDKKKKPSFSKHWEMLNFWGENTHYLVLEEGNEMNDLRAHKIWASRTLNNNKQQQEALVVAFQLFCLEIRKIFVPLFLLESSNFMKLFASTR
jgi:hypothetical protein